MKVFVCEDNFDSILSAIYDAWVESTKIGYANVSVIRENHLTRTLLDEYVDTVSNPQKSNKVVNAIQNKISYKAYMWIYKASLSDFADAPDAIFRFMILGFKMGSQVTDIFTEPSVSRMLEITRRVGNESALFREFVRFNSVDNQVYVSHIEPKCNVIMYVTNHFSDRMPSENFIIIDDNRRIAGIHPKDGEAYFRSLSEDEFIRLSSTETYEDDFTAMWRVFFNSIAIKERENPTCQMNHFAKWKRKHATEFI